MFILVSLWQESLFYSTVQHVFPWDPKCTSSLAGPSPSSQGIKASACLHRPANPCDTRKNDYISWGEKMAGILSVRFKKQHVILWCWKFNEKVRGKLDNVLWPLVVQAENGTVCLHAGYRETTSSSWINPKVHCEPQPKPCLLSQVSIREVHVVLTQNHRATQVWNILSNLSQICDGSETWAQAGPTCPVGFTANTSQNSSCKRKEIFEAKGNLGVKIFSRKWVEIFRCTLRAAWERKQTHSCGWKINLPCRQHSFSHHRSQWKSARVFSLLRHVQPGPFAGLIVPLQKAHL